MKPLGLEGTKLMGAAGAEGRVAGVEAGTEGGWAAGRLGQREEAGVWGDLASSLKAAVL